MRLVLGAVLVSLVGCSSGPSAGTPIDHPAWLGAPSVAPPPAVPAAPAVAPAPAPVPVDAAVLPPSRPLSVQVPSIGVRTGPLIELGLTDTQELEVPHDAHTTGWFELSPTPGEVGPAVIAAHVDFAGVPGVFVRLRDVRRGDEISVARADGTTAVFTAYEVQQHPKSAFPTERVYGNTQTPELRLITCGGVFDDATGDYLDNVVVYARMTSAYR